MGLFLFISDLPSAVTVKQHRFWQISSVRRILCLYPCKIQMGTQIFLVFVNHFLLKQCHFVKFPTVAHTVNYHRKRYCFGERSLVLVGRENSVVYQCCLSVCYQGSWCYKLSANTSLKWLLCIPSVCVFTPCYICVIPGFGPSKCLKLLNVTPSEVCVNLLTDICAAFVAPWPQRALAFLFIELVFNLAQPWLLTEATGRPTSLHPPPPTPPTEFTGAYSHCKLKFLLLVIPSPVNTADFHFYKKESLLHKHIWIHIFILEIKQIKLLFACLNIHSVGDYCCFLSPFLSSMPRFRLHICILSLLLFLFISVQSTR